MGKTTVKVNVIGVGGCGNNLANVFKNVGKKFNPNILNINSSSAELAADSSKDIKRVVIGDGMGAGRNPRNGAEIAAKNYSQIVGFLDDSIEANADYTVNVIIHSLAGGTGGGFVNEVIYGLNEVFADRNTKMVNLDVAILPFIFEANPANSNAVAGLKNLYEEHIIPQHASLVIIDNERFKDHLQNSSSGYARVNNAIVDRLVKLIDYDYLAGRAKQNGLGTFDYSEFLRILQPQKPEGGLYNVYIYDMDKKEEISLVSDLPLKKSKRGVVVFRTNHSPSVKVMEELQKKIGSFVIFKESESMGNGNKAFIITNGMPLSTKMFNSRLRLATKHASKVMNKTGSDKKTMRKVSNSKINKLLDI